MPRSCSTWCRSVHGCTRPTGLGRAGVGRSTALGVAYPSIRGRYRIRLSRGERHQTLSAQRNGWTRARPVQRRANSFLGSGATMGFLTAKMASRCGGSHPEHPTRGGSPPSRLRVSARRLQPLRPSTPQEYGIVRPIRKLGHSYAAESACWLS